LFTASVALAIPAFKLALFFATLFWIGA